MEEARTLAEQAIEHTTTYKERSHQAYALRLLGLGALYRQIGHGEEAHAALSTAIALYRAMKMMFWLCRAEAALAQVEGY